LSRYDLNNAKAAREQYTHRINNYNTGAYEDETDRMRTRQ